MIDFIRQERIFEILAFTVWLTRMFRSDIPPEVIEQIMKYTGLSKEVVERSIPGTAH